MTMRPTDLVWCAGGLIFPSLGVLIRRTSRAEEIVEQFTRTGSVSYTDQEGTSRTAGTDVLPVDWLDRNGDGVYELPTALLSAAANCWATYLVRPQARTGYLRFIEAGAIATSGATVLYVGNAGGTGARFYLESDGTNYRAVYDDGASSVSSTVDAAAPQTGDDVELYWTQGADGRVRLMQRINQGQLMRGALSAALALPSAWGDARRYMNSKGSGSGALVRLVVDKEAIGIQTFADMRGAA